MLQDQVKAGMPVIGANGQQFAIVDHMQGSQTIKLKKGDGPTHHYIPLKWVTQVEGGKVKVDRSSEQATREWSSEAPK